MIKGCYHFSHRQPHRKSQNLIVEGVCCSHTTFSGKLCERKNYGRKNKCCKNDAREGSEYIIMYSNVILTLIYAHLTYFRHLENIGAVPKPQS